MKLCPSSSRGFTMPEVLVAATISVLLLAMVLSVFISSLGVWRESMARLQLSQQSRLAREKMLRGIDGQYGLRHASRATVVVLTNGVAFRDAVNSNLYAILMSTNQPVQVLDTARTQLFVAAPGTLVYNFGVTQANAQSLVINLSLLVTNGGKTYVQPQHIYTYLPNL